MRSEGQNPVLGVIRARRSVRAYLEKEVPQQIEQALFEAGRLAPTARCSNATRFVVVDDPELLKKVQAACMGQPVMGKAPMALIVCSDSTRVMGCDQRASTIDCSIALSFMMLAATAEGLGTCWIGGFEQPPLKEALGIPEEYDVVALTPLGYPAEEGRPRDRKPLAEMVSENGWNF